MRCSNDCSTGLNGCCMVIHGHPSSPDTKVVTGIPGYRAACLVDDVPWMPEAISKSQLKAIKVKQPQRQRKQASFAFPSPRYRLYDVLASSNWGMIRRFDATSFGISACLVVALQRIRFDFAMWRFNQLPALFGTSIIHCLLQVRFIAKPAPLQARDVFHDIVLEAGYEWTKASFDRALWQLWCFLSWAPLSLDCQCRETSKCF